MQLDWMSKNTWTTKDDETLAIKDMKTGHIMNTMDMIHRNRKKYRDIAMRLYLKSVRTYPPPTGEYALEAYMQEIDEFTNITPDQYFRWYIYQSPIWTEFRVELGKRSFQAIVWLEKFDK